MIPPYLYAEISLVTTIGDVDSDNIYQVVCPYLNSSNKITFTVNFDGGDENTYDGGRIKTKISWHENGYTPGDPTAVIAGNINGTNTVSSLATVTNGTASISFTATQIGNSRINPQNDHFDFKIEYYDSNWGNTGSFNVGGAANPWANSCTDNYLTYETDLPWVDLKVWRAADWSNYTQDDETFSGQKVYINPNEDLNNHSGTYNNYIYFINTDDDEYRYKIGTVASQLNTVGEEIALTSNVEKYNTGTSSCATDSSTTSTFSSLAGSSLTSSLSSDGGLFKSTLITLSSPALSNLDSSILFSTTSSTGCSVDSSVTSVTSSTTFSFSSIIIKFYKILNINERTYLGLPRL